MTPTLRGKIETSVESLIQLLPACGSQVNKIRCLSFGVCKMGILGEWEESQFLPLLRVVATLFPSVTLQIPVATGNLWQHPPSK